MTKVSGIPELAWLGSSGDVTIDDGGLLLRAGPATDWFADPSGATPERSAPVLVAAVLGDCQVSANVSVGFGAMFDAGVLFVHVDDDTYAKLCFERSPEGEATVVSVVTGGVSDDANGPVIDGSSVWVRVSLMGSVVAFHHSEDGRTWTLTRLFSLGAAPTSIGFLAQSPTGAGCTARFDGISWEPTTLVNPRDGS